MNDRGIKVWEKYILLKQKSEFFGFFQGMHNLHVCHLLHTFYAIMLLLWYR